MGTATSTNAFITFAKIPVTGVSLDTDTIEGGKIGETKTLTATVTPKGTPVSAQAAQTLLVFKR